MLKALVTLALALMSSVSFAETEAGTLPKGIFALNLKGGTFDLSGNLVKDQDVSGFGFQIQSLTDIGADSSSLFGIGLSVDIMSLKAQADIRPSELLYAGRDLDLFFSHLWIDVCSSGPVLVCLKLPLSNSIRVTQNATAESLRDVSLDLDSSSLPIGLQLSYQYGSLNISLQSSTSTWTVNTRQNSTRLQFIEKVLMLGYAFR